jgi:hypothetical protein
LPLPTTGSASGEFTEFSLQQRERLLKLAH